MESAKGGGWQRLVSTTGHSRIYGGQAEGNNGLPTFTTTFEHYYLVSARTHMRIAARISKLYAGARCKVRL